MLVLLMSTLLPAHADETGGQPYDGLLTLGGSLQTLEYGPTGGAVLAYRTRVSDRWVLGGELAWVPREDTQSGWISSSVDGDGLTYGYEPFYRVSTWRPGVSGQWVALGSMGRGVYLGAGVRPLWVSSYPGGEGSTEEEASGAPESGMLTELQLRAGARLTLHPGLVWDLSIGSSLRTLPLGEAGEILDDHGDTLQLVHGAELSVGWAWDRDGQAPRPARERPERANLGAFKVLGFAALVGSGSGVAASKLTDGRAVKLSRFPRGGCFGCAAPTVLPPMLPGGADAPNQIGLALTSGAYLDPDSFGLAFDGQAWFRSMLGRRVALSSISAVGMTSRHSSGLALDVRLGQLDSDQLSVALRGEVGWAYARIGLPVSCALRDDLVAFTAPTLTPDPIRGSVMLPVGLTWIRDRWQQHAVVTLHPNLDRDTETSAPYLMLTGGLSRDF